MQTGISTYTYTWAIGVPGSMPANPMSVRTLIRKASDLHVDCLQIADNLPLTGMDAAGLAGIREFARDHRIGIEIGGRGLTDENLHLHIELAAYFGSPVVRMVIDGPDYQPETDSVLAIIRNARGKLESSRITLALENHDRLHAAEFRNIIRKSESEYTGICLDCVNSMGIGEDMDTVLNNLAPYTVNLHIKDFIVKRVLHKMGFLIEGTPAGKGLLNLPRLIKVLLPYGRCRSAILELWTPPADNLEETLRRENEWAIESIQYISSLNLNS